MDGFHRPGDPYYYAPRPGAGGWIEASDDEEPMEEPEVPSEEEEPMEEQEASSEEEEPMEEPEYSSDDEEPMEEQGVASEEEEPMEEVIPESDEEEQPAVPESDSDDGEADTEDEVPEVIDPPYPERDMHDPRPPPSFATYRHPNGCLWRLTPRKSVRPPNRSTFEVGQSSSSPIPTTFTTTDADIRALIERVAAHDGRIRAHVNRQLTAEEYTSRLAARVRSLEEDRNLDEEAIQILQDSHAAQREASERRIAELEARVAAAEQRAEDLQRQLEKMDPQRRPSSGPNRQ